MTQRIISRADWRPAELERSGHWLRILTDREQADLRAGLDHLKASGRPMLEITRADVPLGAFAAVLAEAEAEMEEGIGFLVLRGLPMDGQSVDDHRLMAWAIGTHLGVARPQGKASQLMSDVRDAGGTYRGGSGRGYNTNSELDYHTDGSDTVALLCRNTAKSGGLSRLASSVAIHNALLAERPDLVETLYGLFPHSRQNEHAPDEPPSYMAPVYSLRDGHFASRYLHNHIRSTQAMEGEPRLTELQHDALDRLQAMASSPDFSFDMWLEPGDLQLVNNHVLYHYLQRRSLVLPFGGGAGPTSPNHTIPCIYRRWCRRNGQLENTTQIAQPEWFAESCDQREAPAYGFRRLPGGVHLSKTMMFDELQKVLDGSNPLDASSVEDAILNRNILSKPTGTARNLVLSRLNTLYGIKTPLPVQAAMLRLWTHHAAGHPMLALLCALAREPLLRDTASVVLNAPQGSALRWPELAESLAAQHPGRYSQKMLKSLAQNCVSSWTQAGHLKGKVAKRRSLAEPTAQAAAYAALLGSLAGFGGPALLASPWMRVLDRPEADLLSLLRRAEAAGLVQLRAGGGVIQLNVRRPMSQVLGVPALADS